MSPIISPSELLKIKNRENLILADVSGTPNAKTQFESSHLAGARFIDVNVDLAEIKEDFKIGGRHPLPSPEQFSKTLGKLGVKPTSHVVLYDTLNGANAAARMWWMLRAIGHVNVQVLDGGFQGAIDAGFPVASGSVTPFATGAYPISDWQLPIVDMEEVERATQDSDYLIIDVRDEGRYAGEFEPIDTIAGHIPNATNLPFKKNLDSNGHFLPVPELKAHLKQALGNMSSNQVIVHCGSGVTACHTLLAMDLAGMEIANLYVGSWSEWCRNEKEMVLKPD